MHLRVYPFTTRTRRLASFCLTSGLSLLAAALARAADPGPGPDELKRQADRWLELEQRTADERNAWRAQKELLETSIEVLKEEQQHLQSQVEANELASALFLERVEKARTELAAQQAAHTALEAGCVKLEQRLRTLWPRLPEPLQERIRPQLDRLAGNGTPPTLSERAQAVVAALTAVDQFNQALTLTHHLRTNGAGEKTDVKVLYWGLAMAYGIDARGEHAWVIRPGPEGWEWTDATPHAREIRTLIEVQEKQRNAELVLLPVVGEGGAK